MNTFEKLKQDVPEIQKGILLKNFTTYKIGGPAEYFFIAKNEKDLLSALKSARKLKLPITVLGGGSNLLVSDKGIKGLVVKISMSEARIRGNKAFVQAGSSLTELACKSAKMGFAGLEWSGGVPGTIGGAIYGNAQAFGEKISDAVESAKAIDLKTLKLKNFTKKQCRFTLKNSIFKQNKNLVIVSAVLKFKKGKADGLNDTIKEHLYYRRTNHPINFSSAGSVFVNPEIKIQDKKLLEKFPELSGYNERRVIPAGYLIAKSGLAGKKIGNAQISEKHCNFIINLGGAKADDVISLMNLAQKNVKENFGIKLEPEIQRVGFGEK